jgi:ComF family protein
MIHRFKYGQQVRLRRPLALLLLDRLTPSIAEVAPELVLPVPLHTRRLRQRSFNQSLLIAEFLASELSLPLARNLLRRHRWTEPQVQLPAAERIANVRNAFSLTDASAVAGKRILLVDDVFTTGSTLAECSRILKRGKAAAVFGVTVARAPLNL